MKDWFKDRQNKPLYTHSEEQEDMSLSYATPERLYLSNLIVTQNDLRHSIEEMTEYVRKGGFLNKGYLEEYAKKTNLPRVSPLIAISRFNDNKLYIHDGLHRSASVYNAGRIYLREDEYYITDWNYSQYLEIAPEHGWYTPFDPRIHVRTADFAEFKYDARERFKNNHEEATKWVMDNLDRFRTERTFYTISEMMTLLLAQKNSCCT